MKDKNSKMSPELKPFFYEKGTNIDNDTIRKLEREIQIMKNITQNKPIRLIKYFEDFIEDSRCINKRKELKTLYFQFKKNPEKEGQEHESILINFDNEIKELQKEVDMIKVYNDTIIRQNGTGDKMLTSITQKYADYFLSYWQALGELLGQLEKV